MRIISEKQIIALLRILEGTLSITDRRDLNLMGPYTQDYRINLYHEIMNQQSEELKEVK